MSKRGYIQRYLFIIRRVKKGDFPSLQELIGHVTKELAFHQIEIGVSTRTIQRDIEDIRGELGISIEYCRSHRGYYIPQDEVVGDDYIEQILAPFDVLNALGADHGFEEYIIPEKRKSTGTEFLYSLLHCIKNLLCVKFTHYSFQKRTASEYTVEPYGLKEVNGRWYLIAKHENMLHAFGLERISNLYITSQKFCKELNVDINKKFEDCFGIISDPIYPIEDIELAFNRIDGEYIRTFPIHSSQNILKDTSEEFRISLHLRVTPDFIMELLSRSYSIKIIKPESLKKQIKCIWEQALKNN